MFGTTEPTPAQMLAGAVALFFFSLGCVADIYLIIRAASTPVTWRERLRRIRARPWLGGDVLLLFAVLASLNLLFAIVAGFVNEHTSMSDIQFAAVTVPLQTISFHAVALVLILIALRSKKGSWNETFGLSRHALLPGIGNGLVAYFALIPPFAVAAVLYRIVLMLLGHTVEPQGVIVVMTDPAFPTSLKLYLACLALTAAPLIEELLFRGVALPFFVRHARPWLAIAFVSLFFAAIHMHLPSLVPLFVVAVGFSIAYIVSGSIVVPMVMHVLFNSVNLAAIFLLKDIAPLA